MPLRVQLLTGMGHHGCDPRRATFLPEFAVTGQVQRNHRILRHRSLKLLREPFPMPLFTNQASQ